MTNHLADNEQELLTEVDANDNEIGTIQRSVAHTSPDRYHRIAYVAIFNSQNEVVLEQRSKNKWLAPLKWDVAGGHNKAGHSVNQTAEIEIKEEMGIRTEVCYVSKFLRKMDSQSEYCYLFYTISDGPYQFDNKEIEQVKAFNCEKLLNREYDQEFVILSHVYKFVEELRSVWQKSGK